MQEKSQWSEPQDRNYFGHVSMPSYTTVNYFADVGKMVCNHTKKGYEVYHSQPEMSETAR